MYKKELTDEINKYEGFIKEVCSDKEFKNNKKDMINSYKSYKNLVMKPYTMPYNAKEDEMAITYNNFYTDTINIKLNMFLYKLLSYLAVTFQLKRANNLEDEETEIPKIPEIK
ncbi:MAG: hypothetical protein AB1782_00640 [Cyanobacteriota bacterium]